MKIATRVWDIQLVLLLSSISIYAFLNFGVLPLNLSHIIVLAILLIIIGLVLLRVSIFINKSVLVLILLFLILSIYSLYLDYNIQKIKNIINFFVFFSVVGIVINNCQKNNIIKYYLIITKVFIFFAFLQMFLYYLGIGSYFYSFSFLGLKDVNISTSGSLIRVFSIASEPAALCGILLPAIYLSINRIINKERYVSFIYSLSVIFIVINTFSLIGYLYLMASIIMAFYFGGKISLGKLSLALLCFCLFLWLLLQSDSIQQRINEATSLEKIENSDNLSVMAVYSNILVTSEVLKENPLMGRGVFSHPQSYDDYIGIFYSGGAPRVELNKDDAASLYVRALSEIGVIGFFSLLLLITMLLKRCKTKTGLYPFTIAFALAFILLGIRAGSVNYVILWFYLFSALKFMEKDSYR